VISLHSVGLSLGSAAGIDLWHLDPVNWFSRLNLLSDVSVRPRLLPRGQVAGIDVHAADLLDSVQRRHDVLCNNVQRVQDRLTPLLVENQ
jgi:uncharacterized protein (UPF0276 family)